MKKYVVAVLYYTQRNYYSTQKLVQAQTPEIAKYILLGAILDNEHKQKDRYIRIKSVEVTEVID